MSYVKKEWKIKDFQKGDKEFVAGLNHMEQGIADAGEGGGNVLRYKGTKQNYEDLPTSGSQIGDVWNVVNAHEQYPAGTNFAWDGSNWDALGGTIDLSVFRKAVDQDVIDNNLQTSINTEKDQRVSQYSQLDTRINAKQDIIEDLADIRDGAAKGKTAIQEHQDISGKLDKPVEPVAGQGINIPYYFEVEYHETDAIVKDYTIDLLDKTKAPQQFQMRITAASAQQAGLLQAGDKLKLDTLNQVEANPALSGEEQELAGLQIGENKYKMPNNEPAAYIKEAAVANEKLTLTKKDSSTVEFDISGKQAKLTAGDNITIDKDNKISANIIANPTLAGSEAELAAIQVGTTKYKVPDGVHSFPSTWPISSSYTCSDLLAAVGNDSSAVPGKTFQGGIALSDLTEIGLGNAEAEIEIISSVLDPNDKVIRLNVYSANREPYSWARMYWWQGSAAASSITPWQITARAADQYTNPVATGTVNNTTGVVTFTSGSWTKGIYLISMYGQQGGNNTSRTYYFAYGGYSSWICYSGDCYKSRMSSLNGSLIYTDDTGTGGPNWDADPTIELYKMR